MGSCSVQNLDSTPPRRPKGGLVAKVAPAGQDQASDVISLFELELVSLSDDGDDVDDDDDDDDDDDGDDDTA